MDRDVAVLSATIQVMEVVAGDMALGQRTIQSNIDDGVCASGLQEGELWVLEIFGGELSLGLCSASRGITGEDDPWLAELRAATE